MSFISDSFNTYGLRAKVPRFKEALQMIKGDFENTEDEDLIDQATRLYGLIHARYIITTDGMKRMKSSKQTSAKTSSHQ